jgi:hypothetical protein
VMVVVHEVLVLAERVVVHEVVVQGLLRA